MFGDRDGEDLVFGKEVCIFKNLVGLLVAGLPCFLWAQSQSTSRDMSFEDCLKVIQRTAAQLGVAPVNIVETPDLRMVRFVTADGGVLATCSRPDRKMVLTRSKS